jgi:protein gp37
MAAKSEIQWTQATWNPWHGCKKVSLGCKYCYMYRDKERYGQDPSIVMRSKGNFNDPLKWKNGLLIFTCSWSDFFIEEADAWRQEAWDIIRKTPEHTYQILTKRPERILQCLPKDWGSGYPNVWLGVSIESQEQAERANILKDIPAWTGNRFISAEPLIGPLEFPTSIFSYFSWIIIGGESGNTTGKYLYRPSYVDWITRLLVACHETPCFPFVKQLGAHLAKEMNLEDRSGGDISEWYEYLKIRKFPKEMLKHFEP